MKDVNTPVIPRQATRLTTTNAVEINRRKGGVNSKCPSGNNLPRITLTPSQVVPTQIFTPYDCVLISVKFFVLSRWLSPGYRCGKIVNHISINQAYENRMNRLRQILSSPW